MTARLRLERLDIKNYRSIKDFSLPRDGLAWDEARIPDVCLIGGANGSGKTSLLEVIYYGLDAVSSKYMSQERGLWLSQLADAELHVELSLQEFGELNSVIVSNKHIGASNVNKGVVSTAFNRDFTLFKQRESQRVLIGKLVDQDSSSACGTGTLYFPSQRYLAIPSGNKAPGRWREHTSFIWKWKRPGSWENSIEQRLYTAKYADLLSKENGSEHSRYFDDYQQAFRYFFQGEKELAFSNHGELFVRCRNGSTHSLEQLSSGEQQILVLIAELHYRWLPNAIVLFDEPELHLHAQWLSALWDVLIKLRAERGGQLIVATQSNHLFRNSPSAGKVLLR